MQRLVVRRCHFLYFITAILFTIVFQTDAQARRLFVSPSGDNSQGTSWKKAWQTFSDIDWDVVQSGDRIVLDGGTDGVTYTGALIIPKDNIVVRQSRHPKHKGQVTISGPSTYGLRPDAGVVFNGNNCHLIGNTRSGIIIKFFAKNLITMQKNYCSIRNVKMTRTVGYPPYGGGQIAGVIYGGYYNRVLNCDMRDCSNGAVESPVAGVTSLTVFRNCTFGNDGYGYWGHFGTGIIGTSDTNANSRTYVRHCVFGPFYNKGIDLKVGDLSVTDSLFLGAFRSNLDYFPASGSNSRVRVKKCTFYQSNFSGYSPYTYNLYQISTNGNGSLLVKKSIAYGGVVNVPAGTSINGGGNVQYRVSGNTQTLASVMVNPLYANDAAMSAPVERTTISPRVWSETGYQLNAGSPAQGKGSSITDVTSIVPAYGPTYGLPHPGGP